MKFIFIIFVFIAFAVVYSNYLIAKAEEEKNLKYITEQRERQKIAETLMAKSNEQNVTIIKSEENTNDSDVNEPELKQDTSKEDQDTSHSAPSVEPATEDNTTKSGIKNVIDDLQNTQAAEEQISEQKEEEPQGAPLLLTKSLPGKDISVWDSGKSFLFSFNQEVDLVSFHEQFLIRPSTDGKFSGDMMYGPKNSSIIVTPIPALEKGNYTITLQEGINNFEKTSKLREDIIIEVEIK